MTSNPRLLLFATKLNVLRQARELGFSVVNFDKPERVDAARREAADEVEAIDWTSPDDYLGKALRAHLKAPFAAALAFGEYTAYPAALVTEHLGLVGNPLRPVFLANEKPLLRALLAGKSDFAVRFARIDARPLDALATAEGLAQALGLPLILKPTNSSGSAGVALCQDLAAVTRYLHAHDYAAPILAEEFLDGPEISVEAFSAFGRHTVLAVTAKETTGAPRFIETGHRQPAALGPSAEGEVVRLVTEMLSLIGHELGPSHTELRLTPQGPRIIETHTRPGGDGIADLTELTTGVDVFLETLKVVKAIQDLGYEAASGVYAAPPRRSGTLASSQFFLFDEGEVLSVDGIQAARELPGVVELEVSVAAGQVLSTPVDSHTRHGSFVVTATSSEELAERIRAVRRTVRVTYAKA
jgi:biotin carboxylase